MAEPPPAWLSRVNVGLVVQRCGLSPDEADALADMVGGAALDDVLTRVRARWATAQPETAERIVAALELIAGEGGT